MQLVLDVVPGLNWVWLHVRQSTLTFTLLGPIGLSDMYWLIQPLSSIFYLVTLSDLAHHLGQVTAPHISSGTYCQTNISLLCLHDTLDKRRKGPVMWR